MRLLIPKIISHGHIRASHVFVLRLGFGNEGLTMLDCEPTPPFTRLL